MKLASKWRKTCMENIILLYSWQQMSCYSTFQKLHILNQGKVMKVLAETARWWFLANQPAGIP